MEESARRGSFSPRTAPAGRGPGAGSATQVETINVDSRLSQAARRIADVAISSLPVVDHGRLVGIVTTLDVLKHAGKVLPR